MEKWQWEELEAQVEDHGPHKIEFILDSDTHFQPGRVYEVTVDEVKFEDGLIKVVVS